MIHYNTGFVLHYNILLMQPFRVSSVDVSRLVEPRISRVLLCFILYAFVSVYLRVIFVFLGVFSLRSSSLVSYCCHQNFPVQSCHRQKSHQHCKTIAFLKLPSQSQTSFNGSSQSYQISKFHQIFILSLRGGVRDILTHQHRSNPNFTLCASQVSYLYQKSISLGFSLLYIHML